MDTQVPDLNVVAMLAWSEVMEAGVMDVVVGQRDKRRLVHGPEQEHVVGQSG